MIVTLLTDFGTADYFVGAMKGAVLSVNPRGADRRHHARGPAARRGGRGVHAARGVRDFPGGHGSRRGRRSRASAPRAARSRVDGRAGTLFVGPDNGVFGHVYERVGDLRSLPPHQRRITSAGTVSPTFHGRDIFAPVAGALSRGVAPEALGPEVDRLRAPAARRADATRRTARSSAPSSTSTASATASPTSRRATCRDEDGRDAARALVIGGREIQQLPPLLRRRGQRARRAFRHLGQRRPARNRRLPRLRRARARRAPRQTSRSDED